MTAVRVAEWAVIGYFGFVNTFYGLLLFAALLEMRRHRSEVWHESRARLLASQIAPRISVLAPAYNEGAGVGESVRSLLLLQYPNLEVVVINDGSTDVTLAVLQRDFELVPVHPVYRRQIETRDVTALYRSATNPGLVVVDKVNGGKADALNVGLSVASGELVCAIDADTVIEADAMLRMVRPFLRREDVLAAGGTIRVANGGEVLAGRLVRARVPRHPLAGVQVVEYLRAFLFGRLGWNRLGGNLIISGAFGLFRRDAVLAAGGYVHDTVGEDMELVANLRRRGAEVGGPTRIEFVPDPVAWTEVPESLRTLGRQRDRWQRGLCDVMWRHRRVIGNPTYGVLGLVTFPFFFVAELLGPVVEILALLGLAAGLAAGVVDAGTAALFFAVAYGYSLMLQFVAITADEIGDSRYRGARDHSLLLLWALLESLGYRQLTTVWRVKGIVNFLRKRKDWGVMTRTGFGPAPHPATQTHATRGEA